MIRAKEGFIIQKMMNDYMILAIGENAQAFRSIIQTNETGAFYWHLLEKGTTPEDMVKAVLEHFTDVDEPTAKQNIQEFLESIAPAVETIQE